MISERKILITSTVLIAIVVVLMSLVVMEISKNITGSRLRTLSNVALPLSSETDRAFQAMDLVLRNVVDSISSAGIRDVDEMSATMSTLAAHDIMRARISAFSYIDALTLLDETGKVLNTTRFFPPPNVNYSNRDYFNKLKDLSSKPFYLNRPMFGQISSKVNLILTRRVVSSVGAFLGVVNAAIDRAYFETALADVDLGPGGLIALVRDDGTLLAKSPGGISIAIDERDAHSQALAEALDSLPTHGGLLSAGLLESPERLAVSRRLANFPASIVVTTTSQTVDEEILSASIPVVLAAVLLCVVIGLMAFALGRQARNERRLAASRHRQARLDTLTHLHNRLWCAEHLEALAGAEANEPFALIVVGLDFFKAINDRLGHDVGDELLQAIAMRLKSTLRNGDELARVGGDEFAITRCRLADEAEALSLAERIIAVIQMPISIRHHQIVIRCSIGIAFFPGDAVGAVTLLKNADLALQQAKAEGRGVARVFSEQITRAIQTRNALQLDLNEAWRYRQFYVEYQPIFEIGSRGLAGFEALLRWKHPERGNVRPDIFIPIVEETGLILALGAWVLEEACREAMRWPSDLFISVNLSPVQFRGGKLERHVHDALKRSGLPNHRLELEVTESTLLHEGSAVQAAIDQFRRLGIAVALDDFGTGYSSLAYLKHLSIDRIKVDRSFVSDAVGNPSGRAILKAIFGLAAAIGVQTTAEGIESEDQIAIMKQEGCTHLQGYLLGRPMSKADALLLIEATTRKSAIPMAVRA
jgi:diguanylate cyclase (GGDEF)-like protein